MGDGPFSRFMVELDGGFRRCMAGGLASASTRREHRYLSPKPLNRGTRAVTGAGNKGRPPWPPTNTCLVCGNPTSSTGAATCSSRCRRRLERLRAQLAQEHANGIASGTAEECKCGPRSFPFPDPDGDPTCVLCGRLAGRERAT
jgi:hypothetical protein